MKVFKRTLALALSVCMLALLVPFACLTAFSASECPAGGNHNFVNGICSLCGGCETPALVGGWYEIANYGNLQSLSSIVSSGNTVKAKLVADIVINSGSQNSDYSGSGWDNIWRGTIGTADHPFTGTFDGNGHTITGLYMSFGADYGALFSYAQNATIQNLTVDKADMTNLQGSCAVFVGHADKTVIKDCTVKKAKVWAQQKETYAATGIVVYAASVVCDLLNGSSVLDCHAIEGLYQATPVPGSSSKDGLKYSGGIVAHAYGKDTEGNDARCYIKRCSAENIKISCYYAEYLGGIVGQALYTDVTDSIFSYDLNSTSSDFGVISGGSTDIGGIIGCASAGTTVINCLSVPRSLTGNRINQHVAGYIYTVQDYGAIVTGNYSNYVQTTVYNKYPDSFEFVTNEQLASGEVCYLLNGCPTDITGHIFTQDLPTALVPTNVKVLGNRVMPTSPCATSYYNPDDPEIERRYKYHVADSATLTMLPTGSAYGKISAVCADCGESFIMYVDKIPELCVLPEGVTVDARHSTNKYINAYRKFVTGSSAPFTISVDDGCQVFISGPDGEDFEMLTPVDHDDENGKTIYRTTITDIPAKVYSGKSLLVFVTKHDGTCYAPFTINAANDVTDPKLFMYGISEDSTYTFPEGVDKTIRFGISDESSVYAVTYKRCDVSGYDKVTVAEFEPDEVRGDKDLIAAFDQGFGRYLITVTDYAGNSYSKYINVVQSEAESSDSRFPDPVFCDYLYDNFDTDESGYLTTDELSAIKSVSVSSKGIFSLEGIQYLTGLEFLNCGNNRISSLDLSNNTNLTYVHCSYNFLTSLVIGENDVLTDLDCDNNYLESLDVTKLPSLESLYAYENNISSLDLTKNVNLAYLNVGYNGMTELLLGMHPDMISAPLILNNNLTYLDIRGTNVFDEGFEADFGPQDSGTLTICATTAQQSDINAFNRYYNSDNWEDLEFVFDDTMYTVEVYLDIDDEYPVAGYELYSGMLVSAPAEPGREGFRFDGWFTDKACKNAFVSGSPLESDLSLYPKWTKLVNICWYLFVDDEEPVAGVEWEYGTCFDAPSAPARDGYRFDGWFTDKSLTVPYDPEEPVYTDLSLYPLWTPEVTELVSGDFDGDGFFTSADLIYACQLDAGIITEDAGNVKAIDVDGDGSFTSADLIFMCQYDAGIISVWPKDEK